MRHLMILIVTASLLLCGKAFGDDIRTTGNARLDLSFKYEGEAPILLATVTNTGSEKIAFITHWDFLDYHGWKLTIKGPGGEYMIPPPPGAIVFLGPEHFVILKPGQSQTKKYSISSALSHGGQKRLESTPGTYQASISYSFNKKRLPVQGGGAGEKPLQFADGVLPDNGPAWQKLIKEVYFVDSMSSKTVQFTIK